MVRQVKGFTIVELIVSIAIIIILGVIGFVSFSGYLVNVRDSSRKIDFDNMEATLNYHIQNKGYYPLPTDYVNVTYSGAAVWHQGTFGDTVIADVEGSKAQIIDPLTGNEYTYSVKNTRKEYQIGGAVEAEESLSYTHLVDRTHAASKRTSKAIVVGNYNGQLVSVSSGIEKFVLAIPSIIASDLASTDVVDIINNKKLVYNGYANLPTSYQDTVYETQGGFDYTPNKIVVYQGDFDDLNEENERMLFLESLQETYEGTIIEELDPSVSDLSNAEVDIQVPSDDIADLGCDVIEFKLNYPINCDRESFLAFYLVDTGTPANTDTDGDGMPDVYEDGNSLDKNISSDAAGDPDGDSVTTYEEFLAGTDPNDGNDFPVVTEIDIDGDGMGDSYENENGLNPNDGSDADNDNDSDGATNYEEFLAGTDPNDGSDTPSPTDEVDVVDMEGFPADEIFYVFEDSIGKLWYGTDEGLVTRNNANTDWDQYNKKNSPLTTNTVKTITEDNNGDLWLATPRGAFRFDKNDTWDRYDHKNGLPGRNVLDIFGDSSGNMWFATTKGAAKFNGNNWTKYEQKRNGQTNGLINKVVNKITESSDGHIWFATNRGVSRLNGTTWSHYYKGNKPLPSNKVNTLYEDMEGNMWFGTDEGASKFNLLTQEWTNYDADEDDDEDGDGEDDGYEDDDEDGLEWDKITSIYQYADGSMWFGCNKGIVKRDNNTWKSYERKENSQIIYTLHKHNNLRILGTKDRDRHHDGDDDDD